MKSVRIRVGSVAGLRRLTTALVAAAVIAAMATGLGQDTNTASGPLARHGIGSGAPARAVDTAAVAGHASGIMPVAFVANRGQTDPRVRYVAMGSRYAFFATRHELMLSLSRGKPAHHLALALRFLDPGPQARVTADRKVSGTVNYLDGRHPSVKQTGLSRYRDIVYRNLWPRIDLRLHERAGAL